MQLQTFLAVSFVTLPLLMGACSGDSEPSNPDSEGSSGKGGSVTGTGGAKNTGGSNSAGKNGSTGGSTNNGTGGSVSAGSGGDPDPDPGSGGTIGASGGSGSAGKPGTGGAAGTTGTAGSVGVGGTSGTAELDAACTPDFTLDLSDKGPGGKVFTDAIPEPETFVQQVGREVCRVLYRKPEEVRSANHITLHIANVDGVAAKWGDVGDIDVQISTRHLTNVKNAGRDVREEITGILQHEMTHMYQNDDKPEANYRYIGNMYEGIADFVRIRNGHPPQGAAPNDKSGNWYDKTYVSQAFFWLWVDTKYPNFVYRLNASMKKDGKPWQPTEVETITGQTADALWQEYGAAACCKGSNRACCK